MLKPSPQTLTLIFAFMIVLMGACTLESEKPTEDAAEVSLSEKLEQGLTPWIETLMTNHELPGLSIAVVHGGETVYLRGFGYEDVETRKPVTPASVFHMASISKTFVATAIAQLVEQGKVNLNSPVVEYLPYFEMEGDDYRTISVQQMLSHISGMPDSGNYEWDLPQYDGGALERYVRGLSTEKLIHQPGEAFSYSNVAVEVLGDVVAKVSGQTFEDYQRDHILARAQMNQSTFLKPEYLPEGWAAPHARTTQPIKLKTYPYNRRHAPSSTLHSNAADMANWMIANLNRGEFSGSVILSADSYSWLWKSRFTLEEEEESGSDIGLSWFISEYRGERTVGHGGSDEGFHTNLLLLPERSIGVVVMANTLPAPVDQVTHAALDILLGHELTDPTPLASPIVWDVFERDGLDAAVATWQEMQSNRPTEFDFGMRQFMGIYFAVKEGRLEEAKEIARLSGQVLLPEEVAYLQGLVEYATQGDSENAETAEVLEAFDIRTERN